MGKLWPTKKSKDIEPSSSSESSISINSFKRESRSGSMSLSPFGSRSSRRDSIARFYCKNFYIFQAN